MLSRININTVQFTTNFSGYQMHFYDALNLVAKEADAVPIFILMGRHHFQRFTSHAEGAGAQI